MHGDAAQDVIGCPLFDGTPLRLGAFIIDILQGITVAECLCVDERHAGGDGHAFQVGTACKGTDTDIDHAIRDDNCLEVGAIVEAAGADALHGGRDADGAEGTACKRKVADGGDCHAVNGLRDRYGRGTAVVADDLHIAAVILVIDIVVGAL